MELDKDLNLTIPQKTRILEKIRTDLQGRNSFKMFLAKEFAEENLLFVEAVENFDDSPADERYDIGFKIYETFVKSGSPKEVNIEAACRKNLAKKFEASEIKKYMFKAAFDAVLATLRDDNLMRYMKSAAYEKFIEKLKQEKETNAKGKAGGITPSSRAKKSPGGTPSASPGGSRVSPGGSSIGHSDGDILDLMFQVYEDVKEGNHAELLQEQETTELGGVTDFEMFLLQDGGGSPATPTPKEKKEKKPKEGGKKPSFWQRMTDEQKRKKSDNIDKKKQPTSDKPKKKEEKGGDEFDSYLK